MNTRPTATVTTPAGNTARVDLLGAAAEFLAGYPVERDERPFAARIAARLDGREFACAHDLDQAMLDLLMLDGSVFAPVCPVCGDDEETCDCVCLGDDLHGAIAERMGVGFDRWQVEAMVDLLVDHGHLGQRDGGPWMMAAPTDAEWATMITLVATM